LPVLAGNGALRAILAPSTPSGWVRLLSRPERETKLQWTKPPIRGPSSSLRLKGTCPHLPSTNAPHNDRFIPNHQMKSQKKKSTIRCRNHNSFYRKDDDYTGTTIGPGRCDGRPSRSSRAGLGATLGPGDVSAGCCTGRRGRPLASSVSKPTL
jgi:hypothetical protein